MLECLRNDPLFFYRDHAANRADVSEQPEQFFRQALHAV